MKKIKEIMLIAFILFCSIGIINAEVNTVDGKTYVSGKRIYCGDTDVFLYSITKNGKAIVMEAESGLLHIWNENNTCTDLTAQDYLDDYNSPTTDTYESGNIVEIYYLNYSYYDRYVLNTEDYNEDETYYEYDNVEEEMVEASVDENTPDITSYFVLRYFRYPETTTVDPNETYYKDDELYDSGDVAMTVDNSVVNSNNIYEYYIETTLSSAISDHKMYVYNETIYNNISADAYQVSVEVWDGKMYLIAYEMDLSTSSVTGTTYYDENGNEITEYKNNYISFTENYRLSYSYINKDLKVYDKSTNKLVSTITFDDGNLPFSLTNKEYNGNLYFLEFDSPFTSNFVRKYEVTDGNNQSFNNEDITIKFNGNYKLFTGLLINGEELDSKYYTSKEGSTIITLDKSYLRTLGDGDYTLTATYSDGGSVDATFKVSNNPQTLDNIYTYVIFGLVSIILSVCLKRKLVK